MHPRVAILDKMRTSDFYDEIGWDNRISLWKLNIMYNCLLEI
jgi:hypothetical protein